LLFSSGTSSLYIHYFFCFSENKYKVKFEEYREALKRFTDQFSERKGKEFAKEQRKGEKMHNDEGWCKKNAVEVTTIPKESCLNIVDLSYNENQTYTDQTSQVSMTEPTRFNKNRRKSQDHIDVLT
jgi:hypothetical protein